MFSTGGVVGLSTGADELRSSLRIHQMSSAGTTRRRIFMRQRSEPYLCYFIILIPGTEFFGPMYPVYGELFCNLWLETAGWSG